MKKVIEISYCDICGKKDNTVTQINYPVVFHTEQNEGREVEPYISQERLDVCDECLNKIAKIDGYGAQGYNKYHVRK